FCYLCGDPAPPYDSPLSLHDALPISRAQAELAAMHGLQASFAHGVSHDLRAPLRAIDSFSALLATHLDGGLDDTSRDYISRIRGDRKSTRLNSSHVKISYAVFCLKKK